ncbi:putative TPR repeat-containing protein [Acorus calamus]|uniref:TPR repeat-containing protein n=1 Tax=Acorus calamus TaxID=4465 RepID=A0AAV9CHJ4_ACOCL|nr:putative TPR repeat-containing protein [Acorus calamus]
MTVAPPTKGPRAEKVRRIFERFDANADGGLDRSEMAALVVAVNPRVNFSEEQINAILDEVFRTYSEFIDADRGLTLPGLLRTYDDGAGDVDRDFDALRLQLDQPLPAAVSDPSSSHPPLPVEEPQPARRGSKQEIVFDNTWKIVEDLEILIKRLRVKQAKKDGNSNNNSDACSDAGWSRDLGPSDSDRRPVYDESGPDYVVFLKELNVLRGQADSARSREEAFDGGVDELQRACELQPTDVRPHFRAGSSLHALGRHAEAKEELLLALEAAEAGGTQWAHLLPQVHVNLGMALEAEGFILGACEHYREAAILSPNHYRALKLLGSALYGVGEYRAAEKALTEAVYLRPDYANAHCDLGSALHALGDDEKAIQEFQKAIDLKPGHVEALYNLGGLFIDAGRFQRASEMYTRVLAVWPNQWRAQLNKAIALFGAGETEEARKAMKEAFKMTKRIEVHDAIVHMKQLQKKKKKKLLRRSSNSSGGGGDGDGPDFVVVEVSKFKRVGRKTTVRQELASALEIRAFQMTTRLGRCDVELLKKEMGEADVPVSYSGTSGAPQRSIRKAALEIILRRLLRTLKAESFQGAMRAINERILSVLDASGSGRVDLAMFFAVLAPLCSGPPDRRKRVVFDALLWRPVNETGSTQIKRTDAIAYIKILRAVYVPLHGVSDMMEVHGESDVSKISFPEFLAMFDDPDWGFGILSTLVKLEEGDRKRHGRHICAICRYPIVGSRFKETRSRFSLCNRCYSEGKVPLAFKQEEYSFKEYGSESEALKDKCACFNLHSRSSQGDEAD